jgi:spermidine synthase
MYYSRQGPAGEVMQALHLAPDANVGVVGLGAGAMACYAAPGQHWDYFELDDVVSHIAQDANLFTYLRDCAPQANIVLGDARQSLRSAPDALYDVLVMDAYGSDSVPMHLLTSEAMNLYLTKLRPTGVLLFHVSNKYYDLEPFIGKLAQVAGITARICNSTIPALHVYAHTPSMWIVAAQRGRALPRLVDLCWKPLRVPAGTPTWSDDFSSALGALRWSEL